MPELHFQAVLVISRLRNTCNLADVLQVVPWTALVREESCLRVIFGWNSNFAAFTIPPYRCNLFKSFADWPIGTKLPCVHSPNGSVCYAPVCSSIMIFSLFPLARATWRGALAISDMFHKNCNRMESTWDLYPMIWRLHNRRQRCRRRLLKSAPSPCERVWAQARLFCINLVFGRAEVQESPCNSFSANRFLSLCSRCIMFWCELQRFVLRRLSVSAFFRFLGWCEVPRHVKETLRNTSKPAHPWHKAGFSGNVVLQEFSLWFLIWFLGWTAPESASGLDQQLQSVNMYASIKDVTSFQEHPKSSFVAKCLSSVHNVCKRDGSTYPGPLLRWKGPCEGWLLASCDLRFLVCFLFWSLHIPPFGLWQSVANGTLTKMINYPPSRGLTWICTVGQVPLCYSS